jgi:hypothetical protein
MLMKSTPYLSLPYQLCLVILLFIVWLMPHQHRRSHHPLLYWRQLGQMVEREREKEKKGKKTSTGCMFRLVFYIKNFVSFYFCKMVFTQ